MKVTIDWPEPYWDGEHVVVPNPDDNWTTVWSPVEGWTPQEIAYIPLEVRSRAEEIWRKHNQAPEEKLKALIDELEHWGNAYIQEYVQVSLARMTFRAILDRHR